MKNENFGYAGFFYLVYIPPHYFYSTLKDHK